MPRHNDKLFLIASVCVATILLETTNLSANPPNDAVLLDGLSVLVGGRAGNETEAIAVLHSDVSLQTKLMQLYKGGSSTKGKESRSEARRVVVLVTVLAAQARQFQEKAEPAQIDALKELFTQRIGNSKALNGMLGDLGMTDKDLDTWLENIVLASGQIRYVESQVELPTSQEISANLTSKSKDNKDTSDEDQYDKVRRQILAGRLVQNVKTWLYAVLESANVRIVK